MVHAIKPLVEKLSKCTKGEHVGATGTVVGYDKEHESFLVELHAGGGAKEVLVKAENLELTKDSKKKRE